MVQEPWGAPARSSPCCWCWSMLGSQPACWNGGAASRCTLRVAQVPIVSTHLPMELQWHNRLYSTHLPSQGCVCLCAISKSEVDPGSLSLNTIHVPKLTVTDTLERQCCWLWAWCDRHRAHTHIHTPRFPVDPLTWPHGWTWAGSDPAFSLEEFPQGRGLAV